MTGKLFTAALLVSALPLAACERPAARPDAEAAQAADSAAAVKQVEAEMLAAFQAKDAAKLASYYSDDALVATSGRSLKGKDAIAKATAEDFADPAFALTFANERTDVASSGDLAYTSGTYSVSYTNPATKSVDKDAGSYLTVFRKQADGAWKAVADIATPGATG